MTKLLPLLAAAWWGVFAIPSVLAEDGTDVLSNFPWQLVGSGGALTMLGWYLYYNVAYAEPRRQEQHQKHVQEIVSNVNGLTESFREEAKELRQWHTQQVAEARRTGGNQT